MTGTNIVLIIIGFVLFNTVLVYTVMTRLFHGHGEPTWGRSAVCAVLLPISWAFLPLRIVGVDAFLISMVMDVPVRVARVVSFVTLLVTFGIGALVVYGAENFKPTRRGGMTADQFRTEFIAAAGERLEGTCNTSFQLPEDPADSSETTYFEAATYDGIYTIEGTVENLHENCGGKSPAQVADLLGRHLDYVHRNGRTPPGSTGDGLEDAYRILVRRKAPEIAQCYQQIVPRVLPDAATLTQWQDWHSSGQFDLATSATTELELPAWALALNVRDLAAYQAQLDPTRTHYKDSRTTEPRDTFSDRLRTMIQQTYRSPYGDLSLLVEVHAEARTAAQDVYSNKSRLPLFGREQGLMQVILPELSRGGDHFVALRQQRGPRGVTYAYIMEGFRGNVWYRFEAPVQPQAAHNAALLKIMNMQKYKIAKVLGEI